MTREKWLPFHIWVGSACLAVFFTLGAGTAMAQYPGQITKKDDASPQLRAVSVIEWTGESGTPKASRVVPIAIYDGDKLHDGGLYLARPMPLAVAHEVEYFIEQNGKRIGIFDVGRSGIELGSWVGYGKWKPIAPPVKENPKPTKVDVEDEYSDRPVLHRKHHASDTEDNSDSSKSTGPADPDRPTLHKKSTDNSDPSTAPDSDRPVLHKKSDDTTGSTASDPDRPVLKKSKNATTGDDDENNAATDPDRPRLRRGKPSDDGAALLPSLMGMPQDMQQTVGVSDAKTWPEHPWDYEWSNPDDENKMQVAMEKIARTALAPSQTQARPAQKRTTTRTTKSTAKSASSVVLDDIQFRVFELAYSSGATLVLSAHAGDGAQKKFVTLIAQPDLYGNVSVLLKNVTDAGHLDDAPRMRLIDAVDAEGDNRGELLFELRGTTQRQFALYRVLRGQAEKIFASSEMDIRTVGKK